PKYEASQYVPDFPYAGYAESLGLIGIRVDQPEQIARAWDQAFAANRPVVLEAVTDPEVPTLPPHISFEQAANFMWSLVKGDPARASMLRNVAKDAWQSVTAR